MKTDDPYLPPQTRTTQSSKRTLRSSGRKRKHDTVVVDYDIPIAKYPRISDAKNYKIICNICGASVSIASWEKHVKSKSHLEVENGLDDETRLQKKKQKYPCPYCGVYISPASTRKHIKTAKCRETARRLAGERKFVSCLDKLKSEQKKVKKQSVGRLKEEPSASEPQLVCIL